MRKSIALCVCLVPLSACVSLPSQPAYDNVVWLEQGWDEKERHWFHHATQGTKTFPVPYEFFVELEQPIGENHWFKGLLGEGRKFSDPGYLKRFGFIPSNPSKENPDDLPIGFAKTGGFKIATKEDGLRDIKPFNTIGLTCAGCHTGQLTYNNSNIRMDGGPAVTDLSLMGKALEYALAETVADPIRLKRFLKAVIARILRENADDPRVTQDVAKAAVEGILKSFAKAAAQICKQEAVEEGFTRLDALNGIGNTVFGGSNCKNVAPRNAPVSYPQIWSASWFDWVQYDGSIMQPLVRNAGEALGLNAVVQLSPTPQGSQFSSTINFDNLGEMEKMLAGSVHPQTEKRFDGLKSPPWPAAILGKIDEDKRRAGEKLYNEICAGCHRPPVNSGAFWSDKYWSPIRGGNVNFYNVVMKSVDDIGTDSAQADVLATRKVDLTGMGDNMRGEVCSQSNGRWGKAEVAPEADQSFAFALGLVVERSIHRALGDYPSDRPNCLRAPRGYKARPLNGIWATAPYLHNGSVANLFELLSPVSERAEVLYLGYQGFDPMNVGYVSTTDVAEKLGIDLPGNKGLTKVVVAGDGVVQGNRNTGHEFNDAQGRGVIGRSLSIDERWQLVEFLKSL